MQLHFFTAATALITVACASPRQRPVLLSKEKHQLPPGWSNIGHPSATTIVDLQIGLKQNDMQGLAEHLLRVSDPDRPEFGQHLSREEVTTYARPSDDTIEAVERWLLDEGVSNFHYQQSRDWMSVRLNISTIERLLDAEYSIYENEEGTRLIRTLEYSLPHDLHSHIDTIQPTTSFLGGQPQRPVLHNPADGVEGSSRIRKRSAVDDACKDQSGNANTTIACIQTMYDMKDYKPKSSQSNRLGIANFLDQRAVKSDIKAFLSKYRSEAKDAVFGEEKSIKDGINPIDTLGNTDIGSIQEANLDAQLVFGLTWPLNITTWSVGGRAEFFDPDAMFSVSTPIPNENWMAWLNYLLNDQRNDLPKVISVSYADHEQTVPIAYAKRICDAFMQLGSLGVTVLVASGDRGVGSEDKTLCKDNSSNQKPAFLPVFPASCPWVTVVGATQGYGDDEVAANTASNSATGEKGWASGGGFSNYWTRANDAKWQKDTVDKYVKDSASNFASGMWNQAGRAYPDIAAAGSSISTILGGIDRFQLGTSASAPIVASIMALINDALQDPNQNKGAAKDQKSLGFINPWLYSARLGGNATSHALRDVVARAPLRPSSGTPIPSYCGVEGFPVGKGWDPMTGWGVPMFRDMLKERLAVGDTGSGRR